MMFIIANKQPDKAVEWLIENTDKRFCWKQLLELGQLVCSAQLSSVYEKVHQGQDLQYFCERNVEWVFYYYDYLFSWCNKNIKMQQRTKIRMQEIRADLFCRCELATFKHRKINSGNRVSFDIEISPIKYDLDKAIFRYVKGYECEYESNSELPIDLCCEQYKKYITEYKFGKENKKHDGN